MDGMMQNDTGYRMIQDTGYLMPDIYLQPVTCNPETLP